MKNINYKLCCPQNLMSKPWLCKNTCNTCNTCTTCKPYKPKPQKQCNKDHRPKCEVKCDTKSKIQSEDNNAENIIYSVALMETALSHIINAEGEKIQKILATTDDCQEILDVNQSVHEVIISITHLEQTLYQKLAIAQKLR